MMPQKSAKTREKKASKQEATTSQAAAEPEVSLADVMASVGQVADIVGDLAKQVKVIDAAQETLGNRVTEQAETARFKPASPFSGEFNQEEIKKSPVNKYEATMKRLNIYDSLMVEREHKFMDGDIVKYIGPKLAKYKEFFSRRMHQAIEEKNEERIEEAKHMVDAITAGEAPLGKVWGFMSVSRRNNQPKYKVDFPLIGKDGCLESEIALVQEAT
jgi:hypothetical protein